MSGGSYDYAYGRIEDLAQRIRDAIDTHGDGLLWPDGGVDLRARRAFASLLDRCARAARAIEWNDSGDGADDERLLILAALGLDVVDDVATALQRKAANAAALAEQAKRSGDLARETRHEGEEDAYDAAAAMVRSAFARREDGQP